MIRLFIVEDQPDVLKGLLMRVAAETDFSVVGVASTREAAIFAMTLLHPDLVLIDVDTVYMDGVEVVKALHRVCPQAAIVVLSIRDDVNISDHVKKAGASALVSKSMPTDNLLVTIREVGHSSLTPPVRKI
jgi:DNA-binding NarL/FixJ family response regulator